MQFATSSLLPFRFGISPRADALGGAYTAIADDGATYFYNPAGLGFLAERELSLQYSRLYIGLTDESKIFDGAIYYTHQFHLIWV